MIFIFSLVIAALLCIASFICYKVSGKMLDEKDAEKCAQEAELEEKLIDLIERQKQLADVDEIDKLTDKIHLLSMVEQISYLTLSFGVMFACTLLFVTGIIAVGVLAANVYAK